MRIDDGKCFKTPFSGLTNKKQMNVIKNLSGVVTDVAGSPSGSLQKIHDEPQPGFMRQISLGASGVAISRGNSVVVFPMEELLRLAEEAEPGLKPPSNRTASPKKTIPELISERAQKLAAEWLAQRKVRKTRNDRAKANAHKTKTKPLI